jgi:hypothetical protein
MIPAKLNVFFAFYPYGGNGATSSEHPNIRNWFAKTVHYCKNDPRIGEISTRDFSDTPITMTRNQSVLVARNLKADVIVMVDSDQQLDLYGGIEDGAKDFFPSSFDFLYERKQKGLVSVIGAPYCGPPPSECVYIFKWCNEETGHPNVDHRLAMYSREEGALASGIQPVAALPTGCIMFDMSMFDLTDPKIEYQALLKKHGDAKIARALTNPWFYYEWKDIYCGEKVSTEDVTVSRDMVLCAYAKLGYNSLFCNWDAWAGHWKPKCVGKPVLLTSESVNDKYREAVFSCRKPNHKMMTLSQSGVVGVAKPRSSCYNNISAVNDAISLAAKAPEAGK